MTTRPSSLAADHLPPTVPAAAMAGAAAAAAAALPTAEARRRASARRRAAQRRHPRLSRLLAWLLTAWVGHGSLALAQLAPGALPGGGQVVQGSGTLQYSPNLLVVQQSSNKLGLDWQSFNIGSGATVEFRQPGANAIALNRVLSNTGTEIYGRLQANGQVFLTNPNGVLFAPGAKVDVGGLVASTLDLSQQDFAAGRYTFSSTGRSGAVVNQGSLRAEAGGYLALFGSTVVNKGDMTVDAGSVLLASGRAATVSISGSGLLSAVVAPGLVTGRVDNAGNISADAGVVRLTAQSAQDIAASLVNNSGIVRANTVAERGGEIWITGDNVANTGRLSAAAPAGGDAGRIMLLADLQHGSVQVAGTLDASAAGAGQGGFVETSAARVQVDASTRVTTLARPGLAGTWLVDPTDFAVNAGSGPQTTSGIGADTLAANLATTNVSLATAAAGAQPGDINVNAAVAWAANKLTLSAARNININAALTGSGTASLALEYGLGAVAAGNTSSYNINAAVSLPAGNSFSTKLGSNGSTVNYTVINALVALQLLDGNASVLAGNYALGADIDASSTGTGAGFDPIGDQTTSSAATAFTGRFDGLGHSISSLTINRTTAGYVGLFAKASNATISNLALVGGSVTGLTAAGGRTGAVVGYATGSTSLSHVSSSAAVASTGNVGGLVGEAAGTGAVASSSASGNVTGSGAGAVGGLIGYTASTGGLSDVSSSGTVTGADTTSDTVRVGGLVGDDRGSNLLRGTSSSTVTGGYLAGGLIGNIEFDNARVQDSSASGAVTGSTNVGGLVGRAVSTGGQLTGSSASGNVVATAGGGSVGGLAGVFAMSLGLLNGSASGTVSGGASAGGLVGYFGVAAPLSGSSATGASVTGGTSYAGGLVGQSLATITSSTATSNVSGSGTAGGLVGVSSGSITGVVGTVTASGAVSGTGNVGGLVGSITTGSLTNVASTGNVAATGNSNVGGLAGNAGGSGGMTTVSATGKVTGAANSGNVGGLVGLYNMAGSLSGVSAGNAVDGIVSGGNATGGLVGNYTSTAVFSGGTYLGASVSGGQYVGGLMGAINAAISGTSGAPVTAAATVASTLTAGNNYIGGLAGYTAASVSYASASGNVSGVGYIGGLIGNAAGNTAVVSNSSGSGNVTVGNAVNVSTVRAGGLIGWSQVASIASSSASGNVTSTTSAYNTNEVGGLVGRFDSGSGGISGSSASGTVLGGDFTGGVVGNYTATSAFTGGTYLGSSVTGRQYVGGLMGSTNGAITGTSGSLITVSATVASTLTSGITSVGGLAGYSGGNVSYASASGSVSGVGYIGGLIGNAAGSTATVSNSSASGNVSVGNAVNVSTVRAGGLIGWSQVASIASSSASGNVTSTTSAYNTNEVGGLVGRFDSGSGGISGSSASGTVAGGDVTGGVVGNYTATSAFTGGTYLGNSVTGRQYVGGLMGATNGDITGTAGAFITVSATVASTLTTGSNYIGGLAGYTGGNVSYVSASGNVSGIGFLGGLVGNAVGSTASVSNSSASGSVTVGNATNISTVRAGGLIGYAQVGSISGVSASGNVSTASSAYSTNDLGGLVGTFDNGATNTAATVSVITGASATGNVTGTGNTGGLIGSATGKGALTSSTATGRVTAAANTGSVGGLVGQYALTGNLSGVSAGNTVDGVVGGGNRTGGLLGYVSSTAALTSGTYLGATVSGGQSVGGLVGYTNGAITGTAGALVSASATVSSTLAANSAGYVGGLVGYAGGSVSYAKASGNVSGTWDVGGLVGNAGGAGASIANSSATGNVTSSSTSNASVGGLVGYTNATGGVNNSSASGTVSGGLYAGGLVGWYASTATFSGGTYAGTSVTGGQYVGGLMGATNGAITGTSGSLITVAATVTATLTSGITYVGGLAGYTAGSVSYASASGNVSGVGYIGGLIGNATGATATVSNSSAGGNVTVGNAVNTSNVRAGGLIGWSQVASIASSSASGNVTSSTSAYSSNEVGGLVGRFDSSSGGLSGGISGSSASGTVSGGDVTGGVVGNYTATSAFTGGTYSGTSVTGGRYVGGLMGATNGAITGTAGSLITVSATVASTATTGTNDIGGLAGYTAANVSYASASGNVSGAGYIGGLIGNATGSTASVANSSASGNVTVSNAATANYVRAGGLIGYAQVGSISGVSASGNVISTTAAYYANDTGGLIGTFDNSGTSTAATVAVITAASATGNVSGNGNVGGLIGIAGGYGAMSGSTATGRVTGATNTGYVGGLVGQYAMSGAISGASAGNAVSGVVSGGSYTGGLVGYYTSAAALTRSTGTYLGTSVAGGTYVGGLVGYITAPITGTASAPVVASAAVSSNLTAGQTYVGGLAGYTAGNVTYASATGAVSNSSTAGYAGGLIGYATGSSTGVTITNGVASGNLTGSYTAGGLLGGADYNVSIANSRASGNVLGVSSSVVVGGLVGSAGNNCYYCNSTTSSITGSSASGNVSADAGSASVGGLVGIANGWIINGSSATGNVSDIDSANGTGAHYAGGLVGQFTNYYNYYYNSTGNYINNSTASGNVVGRTYAGGLVGSFTGASISGNSSASGSVTGSSFVGGLVGYFSGTTVQDSSASGTVTASVGTNSTFAGGLIGQAYNTGTLLNVTASGNVTASSNGSSVGGLIGYQSGAGIDTGIASGKVTGNASSGYVGGLVGYAQGNSQATTGTAITSSTASGDVTGGNYSGGLLGYYYGSYSANGGIASSHATGAVVGKQYAGGLIGYVVSYNSDAAATAVVSNSDASGKVSGTQFVGGLVGQLNAYKGISGSFATGQVVGLGYQYDNNLGGLVGAFYGYSTTASTGITGSYATGNVGLASSTGLSNNSASVNAGGLVGLLNAGTTTTVALSDSYSTGNVSVSVPTSGNSIALSVGGLVGQAQASIARTYASGQVTAVGPASRRVGGLVGYKYYNNSTVTSSYWDSTASGQATSAGGTALTSAQMQLATSFTGFDIANTGSAGKTWRIYDGYTTPLLTGFLTPLTLTLADASKTYDGNTSFGNATLGSTSAPVAHPERIRTSALSPDVGSYAVSAAGVYSVQTGYDLTVSGNATLNITPKPLTLAGVIADKVYDTTRTATIIGNAQPTGLVAGEDLVIDGSAALATFDTKNVGTNKAVTVTGFTLANGVRGKASNYTLSGAATTASITPAPLSVGGLVATNRAYDGTTLVALTATANSTVTGVLGNDDVSASLSSVASGTVANKNVGSAKPVTVTGAALAGADAGNYRIVGIDSVTVDITPKALSISAIAVPDHVYDTHTSFSFSSSSAGVFGGLVPGDLVQLASTTLTATMADKNVGTGKAVTIGGLTLRGPDAANYSVLSGAATVNITPATVYQYLTITGAGPNKAYDGTTAVTGVQVNLTGTLGTDDLTLAYAAPAYADKNVAYDSSGAVIVKPITVASSSLQGADAGNYTLNTNSYYYGNTAYGVITPKAVGVTGATPTSRVYDGTTTVSVNVNNLVVDTSALIPGDQVSVLQPGNLSGTVTGTLLDRNVGNAKPVAITGLALTGLDRGNYTLGGSNGLTVNITPKPVTASYTGVDRVYDGSTYAQVTASSNDLLAIDLANSGVYINTNYYGALFTGTGAKNVGANKPISISLAFIGGSYSGNYTLLNSGQGTTTASVTPRPVTPAFTGTDKVYDGGTSATVVLNTYGSNIIGGDAVTATDSAVFTGANAKNVGVSKPISVTGVVLSGADAANYVLASTTATAYANVTAKPVVVSGITASDHVYDGSTVVAVTAGAVGSMGFVAGDNVQVQQPATGLQSGTVTSKNVGSNLPVTVTGLSLSGSDAGNYFIDPLGSGITVNITPRPLTASFTGVDRAYTGGVSANVIGSSADLVVNDSLTFQQNAVFTGLDARNVGTNKPVRVTGIVLIGNDKANYTLLNTTATTYASITAKALTVSYSATNRIYNGLADTSITVSARSSDLVAGDQVVFSQMAALAGDGSAGDSKLVNISGIALSGAQASNYALTATTATTTASIGKRAIGVTGITAVDRAYDGLRVVDIRVGNASVNVAAILGGDDVHVLLPNSGLSTGTMTTKDVGQSKDVQVTGLLLTGAQASNYTLSGGGGITVNITPLQLTAAYTAASRVYDGTAVAQISATSTGILAGDIGALGISANGVFSAGKNAGQGKAVAVSSGFLTGVERNNYALVNASGSAVASITPKTLTPTYLGGSRVYDGGSAAPVTAQTAGIISGDDLAFGQTAVFTAGKTVGNGKAIAVSNIVLAGGDAANYMLSGTTASTSGSITPKAITIAGLSAVTAQDRSYDGSTSVNVTVPTNVTLTPSSSDIVAGDQVTIAVPASGVTTGTLADKNAGNNKLVTVNGLLLSGTDAVNYVVAGANGVTVNIAPKALTASYSGVTRSYDGGTSVSLLGSASGIVTNDVLTITGSGFYTGSGGRNAGSGKEIQIGSAALGGTDRVNYTLLNTTGIAYGTITPKDIAPGYASYTRVYDGTTLAQLTATRAGIVGNDDVQFDQTATFGGKDVGTNKSIGVTSITLSGADAANYHLLATSTSASGSITPRAITLTGLTGVQAVDRVYNGSTTVDINLLTTGTVAPAPGGVLAGDSVIVSVPTGTTTTGTVGNKNAGTNKDVLSIAGLGLSGADAGNYTLVGTSGVKVNITPRGLTAIYGVLAKVYDGTTAASITGTSTDLLAGDSLAIVGSGQFTGSGARNVGTGKAVSVLSAGLTGTDAANYQLLNTTGNATGDITPKSVSVSYLGGTRVYDGSTAAPVTASIAGAIAGDSLDASASASFTGSGAKNVGDYKAVAVSGITLGGSDAGNYALSSNVAMTTASITPKALHVDGITGITAVDRVYDGGTQVALNVAATGPISLHAADLVAGDAVTLGVAAGGITGGTVADKNVGSAKAVRVNGLQLGGADAVNYTVSAVDGLTVNITPRLLTASYVGISRVYDGTTGASVLGSSLDLVSGDTVSIAGLGQFTGSGAKNVGTGKSLLVLSASLAGADSGNYQLTNPTGSATGTITQRSVTALYTGGTRVYDGGTSAPVSGSGLGFISGDDVSLAGSAAFTGIGAKNVGDNKAVSVSGITLGGNDALNYALVSTTALTTASITPKALRVDGLGGITATDRAYDGSTTVAINLQVSGPLSLNLADVVAGDNVSITLPAGGVSAGTVANKNAGQNKAVTVTGLMLGGLDGGNYMVASTVGLTVNITPRLLTATYVGIAKVYDGTTHADVAGLSSGIVSGDILSISGSGVFTAGKNVGQGKAISITSGTLLGADAGNYSLANTTGTATADITPRAFTATYTGGTRVYDGTLNAPVTYAGTSLVAGDDVSLQGIASFSGADGKNVGTGKVVSISGITLAGSDAANYSLLNSSATTTASVTPRPLSVQGLSGLVAVDRVYDGTLNVGLTGGAGGSLSGDILPGDVVTIGLPAGGIDTGLLLDKNAGQGKAVVVAGLTLGGTDAANYSVSGTAGVTVNIAPRPVVLLGVTAQNRTYDGSTVVAVSTAGGSISGAIAGDDLQLPTSGVIGSIADRHAGVGRPVTVSGLSLAGADAGNYVVNGGNALTVTITPAALTLTAASLGKLYGDVVAFDGSAFTSSGLIAGDTIDAVTLASAGAGALAQVLGAPYSIDISNARGGMFTPGDYAVRYVAGTLLVTPRPLTVSAGSLQSVYGNGIDLAAAGFSTSGLVNGETVGAVTLRSDGASAQANASAVPYALTASNASGGSFNPSNYLLAYQAGTLLVTPRPLVVSANSVVRYADQANPPGFGAASGTGFSTNVGGLVNGDSIATVLITAPAASNGAAGGSIFELQPSAATFGSGNAGNYAVGYGSGLLVVLPTPPQIGDGSSGQGLGLQYDPAEVAGALQALERAASVVAQTEDIGSPGGSVGPVSSANAALLRTAQASPADLDAALSADSRRITLPTLQRLPLISLDPALRRLITGAASAAGQATPASTTTPTTTAP